MNNVVSAVAAGLAHSRWIWHPEHVDSGNCFVYFRRVFAVSPDAGFQPAYLHISARSLYRVYLNGTELGMGPSPSTAEVIFHDTYEIGSRLRSGSNCLAALVYAYGPEPQGVLEQRGGCGRFLFALELGPDTHPESSVVSDAATRCLAAPEYRPDTAAISWHLGEYREDVDLRLAPCGWTAADFDDSGWLPALERESATAPAAPQLLAREIPLPVRRTVLPRNAYSIGGGDTYNCDPDPHWEIVAAERLLPGDTSFVPTEDTQVVPGFSECRVRPLPTGVDPTLIVDFGCLANGQLHVDLDAPAGAVVRIGYGESLNVTYVDRFRTRAGRNHLRPFGRRHARYLFLRFSEFEAPIGVLQVRFEHITYPAQRSGRFHASDPVLEQIFTVAADTSELCMHDHFEDCPWREQTLYAGDLHVETLVSALCFGDTCLARKCLRDLFRTQRDDGVLPSTGPRWNRRTFLIDYVVHSLLALRHYVLYSGDLELADALFAQAEAALDYYLRTVNADGLADPKVDEDARLFLDWYPGERPTPNPALNALVVGACNAVADLATWLERPAAATRNRQHAIRIGTAVHDQFFDPRRGLYRDALNGSLRDSYTVRTNALMLLYALAPSAVAPGLVNFIRDQGLAGLPTTPFFNFFVCQALGRAGAVPEMVHLLRAYWGEMLNRGACTFWEIFDPQTAPEQLPAKVWSLCHGWSAGPGFLLPTYVLGVEPASPGWQELRFRPQLADLGWARGAIATPLGMLKVSLQRDKDPVLERPPGMTLGSAASGPDADAAPS